MRTAIAPQSTDGAGKALHGKVVPSAEVRSLPDD